MRKCLPLLAAAALPLAGCATGPYGYNGYGSPYGSAYGYGHGSGGTAYHGAYGRPDVVYPSGGYSAGGRDPGRIAWCRATYRSYDPASGYYRAWSGRRVWCG